MINKLKLNIDKLLKLTHRLDFFEAMSDHERFEVLQHLEANLSIHAKGDVIIKPGAKENHIYIILSGLVTVQKGEPQHTVLNIIKPGDFFGEISFMTKTSADVTVIANEDTIMMTLSNDELEMLNGLIRDKIKDQIIFKLIQRLKHMNKMLLKEVEKNNA